MLELSEYTNHVSPSQFLVSLPHSLRKNSMLGSLQGLPPSNQQQQGQQQQQQQQQQQLQNQPNIPPPPLQNGQDVTLSSVLHFLQSEWRRYERDRNEWEIERAEMRVSSMSCDFCVLSPMMLHRLELLC
jgi:striatin 1/3/4